MLLKVYKIVVRDRIVVSSLLSDSLVAGYVLGYFKSLRQERSIFTER